MTDKTTERAPDPRRPSEALARAREDARRLAGELERDLRRVGSRARRPAAADRALPAGPAGLGRHAGADCGDPRQQLLARDRDAAARQDAMDEPRRPGRARSPAPRRPGPRRSRLRANGTARRQRRRAISTPRAEWAKRRAAASARSRPRASRSRSTTSRRCCESATRPTRGAFVESNPHPFNLVHLNADNMGWFADGRGRHYFRDRYTIGYWFWELAAFRDEWVPFFDYVDEVWAASDFVRDVVRGVVAGAGRPHAAARRRCRPCRRSAGRISACRRAARSSSTCSTSRARPSARTRAAPSRRSAAPGSIATRPCSC